MSEHNTLPPCGFDSLKDLSDRVYFSARPVEHEDEIPLPRDGILLIDDSDDDAELSLRTLGKLGSALPYAWLKDSVSAVEALEHAPKEALPRMILLDLRMPRMDGYEVLKRLKANPRTERISVIVMVGSARAPELSRCLAAGANAHVVKPLAREALVAACERAVVDLS